MTDWQHSIELDGLAGVTEDAKRGNSPHGYTIPKETANPTLVWTTPTGVDRQNARTTS
jgi:hypothetical protein